MDIGFIILPDKKECKFIDEKGIEYYTTILRNKRIFHKYVEDIFNGGLYVYKNSSITFDELIEYFVNYRLFLANRGKTFDACLCLLAYPYFDELCDYVKLNHHKINKKNLRVLKKEIFEDFGDDLSQQMVSVCPQALGSNFYLEHNCYEKSKEILNLLS